MPVTSFQHRILGVDPGTLFLVYAIIEPHREGTKILCMGTLMLKPQGSSREAQGDFSTT
ncbi:MAG: hypothetical protein IPP42_02775 [Saprospiraceae bacterium]|nr:hypothetical protein [Saprospiraceae bacterium]